MHARLLAIAILGTAAPAVAQGPEAPLSIAASWSELRITRVTARAPDGTVVEEDACTPTPEAPCRQERAYWRGPGEYTIAVETSERTRLERSFVATGEEVAVLLRTGRLEYDGPIELRVTVARFDPDIHIERATWTLVNDAARLVVLEGQDQGIPGWQIDRRSDPWRIVYDWSPYGRCPLGRFEVELPPGARHSLDRSAVGVWHDPADTFLLRIAEAGDDTPGVSNVWVVPIAVAISRAVPGTAGRRSMATLRAR
ncbi:hypothetical protein [Sandaracinus amylolyticus]|uniref:hypothetical protein n=1 Tax=Sandaracinus amylolyticus TaxID=927083 RepID=UPI00069D222F|nr:hypothetical protein [Sandaracinus amylolyticus]